MNIGKFVTAAVTLIVSFTANAGIITFDDATMLNHNRIDTAGGGVVTASRNLYNYPDGMLLAYGQGNTGRYAGGYYGEHEQYFQFDSSYYLNSLTSCLSRSYPTRLSIRLLSRHWTAI